MQLLEQFLRIRVEGYVLCPTLLRSIEFPPVTVRVGGWPGQLTVAEATERVEATFEERVQQLARQERFEELEQWLDRFLQLRQGGWRLGLFSFDAHLKNFGVAAERVVLLDTGGLTNRWDEVEDRLAQEETVEQPHANLGLAPVLAARPDIAERFDARWKAAVNREAVRRLWGTGAA